MENPIRQKAMKWWNSKNYDTKKRLSEGYIHPTDSGVDPVMFLDDETIREIYLKEHPTEAETVNNNIKGALNGLCNRTACQKPGANYYNHSTREHYCKECAEMINFANRTDAMRMYGHDLCTLVEQRTEAEVGEEEEAVERAASKYVHKNFPSYIMGSALEEIFKSGANWQKEQDRVLISELLDALKVTRTLNLHLCEPDTVGNRAYKKFQEAITKAEQRIKK